MEKETNYKIGDRITITNNSRNYSKYSPGDSFTIGYISGGYGNDRFVCDTDSDEGNGVFFSSIKKAEEEIINTYSIF